MYIYIYISATTVHYYTGNAGKGRILYIYNILL